MTLPASSADLTREQVEAAIKATEYKYFGDYELSDVERAAVDTLVSIARQHLERLAA
ncbi:MAG: hypothetical protein ACRYG8_02370 [Janthinobacterium lividum]